MKETKNNSFFNNSGFWGNWDNWDNWDLGDIWDFIERPRVPRVLKVPNKQKQTPSWLGYAAGL